MEAVVSSAAFSFTSASQELKQQTWKRTDMEKFDLIIIGGGSAAFSAAIRANEMKLETLLINGGLPLGGTCVNVGCVPSKFLIRAAENVHHASFSTFEGVTPKGADIDFKKIIQQKKELVADLQQKIPGPIEQFGIS
ncbi:MAG: FAD-dependent oxidoreductase [Anditalea sp.]